MAIIVRVIGPHPLLCFQQDFPDGYPDRKILADLERGKRRFGYSQTVVRPDQTKSVTGGSSGIMAAHPDRNGPMVWDDPRTRVVVGEMVLENGVPVGFRETRVLREARETTAA